MNPPHAAGAAHAIGFDAEPSPFWPLSLRSADLFAQPVVQRGERFAELLATAGAGTKQHRRVHRGPAEPFGGGHRSARDKAVEQAVEASGRRFALARRADELRLETERVRIAAGLLGGPLHRRDLLSARTGARQPAIAQPAGAAQRRGRATTEPD